MLHSTSSIVIAPNPQYPDLLALKANYLQSLDTLDSNITGLRQAVSALMDAGVTKPLLMKWAAEAGYDKGHVRTILSKILCDSGARTRKPGAGGLTPA